jgi:glycine oxidase
VTIDVVVLGGGVIGLAVARRSAALGLDVVVVDDRRPGQASGVGAGMLAAVTELHHGEEALLALNLASSEMYPGWVQELETDTGLSTGYRQCGTLIVARDADDNAALDQTFEVQRGLGLDVERLRSSGCRSIEPALASSIRGGIWVEGDHQIDGQGLVEALRADLVRRGVAAVIGRAGSVTIERGAATGVRLDDGTFISAGSVVVACGSWSARLDGIPPGLLPVRPVKGQLLRLRSRRGPLPIQRNVRGTDVYLVPRSDGRLIVGATVEEQGEDIEPTAGAMYELLRAAHELVPGITELAYVDTAVGLRPGTPDNAPLLGATEVTGLIAATGHFRNGILLAPITAQAIGEVLTGSGAPEVIQGFSPSRFHQNKVAS